MGSLKISIVTVSYNSVHTIERTINSVIKQEYPNIEYIVIDGNSLDGTQDIIRKYEANISYWISEPDNGIYDAMNKGARIATGDIIAFMNSDDWYEDNVLDTVASLFENNNMDVLCCDVNEWWGENKKRRHNRDSENPDNLQVYMIYCHQAVFCRTEMFRRYGYFDSAYEICADYDWLLRLYNCGAEFMYFDKVVSNFRHGGVSTTNFVKLNDESRKIALKSFDSISFNSEGDKRILYDKLQKHYSDRENVAYISEAIREDIIRKLSELKQQLREIVKLDNCSVFGGGIVGRECILLFKQMDICIEKIWDNACDKWGNRFEGILIDNPLNIIKSNSVVIVASTRYENEICSQLETMGLEKDKDYILYTAIRGAVGECIKDYCKWHNFGIL